MTHRENLTLSFVRSRARELTGLLLSALLAPVRADSTSLVTYAPPEVMTPVPAPVPSTGATGQELFLIAAGIGILVLAGILALLIKSGHTPTRPPEKKS
jgi:hypothetical protein